MKNLLQNKEFQLNEILFQGRNKDYGAYAIRSDADRLMTKALFAGVALFAAVAITPFVINSFKGPVTIVEPPLGPIVLHEIPDQPQKKPEIVKVQPQAPKTPVNTYDSRTAVPTRGAKEPVSKPPVDASNAVPGTENVVGEPPVTTFTPPPAVFTGPPVEKVIPKVVVDNTPKKTVDIEAKFNGGINAFRDKVAQSFDTGSFDGTGDLMKTTVSFIVEMDGSISNVKASGPDATFNREAERTVKNIKGKWTPAKLKGENVRSYFNFPISMQFE